MMQLTVLEIVLIIIGLGLVLAIIFATIDAQSKDSLPKSNRSQKKKSSERSQKTVSHSAHKKDTSSPKSKMVESLSGPIRKSSTIDLSTHKKTASKPAKKTVSKVQKQTSASSYPTSYQYWKFDAISMRGQGTEPAVQLSSFRLYDGSQWLPAQNVSNPNGSNPSGEEPEQANTALLDSKWLDLNKGDLIYDFGKPVVVTQYNWATANDAPERDPLRWVLSASEDGVTWRIIDDKSKANQNVPLERTTWVAPGNVENVGFLLNDSMVNEEK